MVNLILQTFLYSPSDLIMLFSPLIGITQKNQGSYLTRVFDSIPTADYIGDLYPSVFLKPRTLLTTKLKVKGSNNYYFAPFLCHPNGNDSFMLLTLPTNRPCVRMDTGILFIQAWIIAKENKFDKYLVAHELGMIPDQIMDLLQGFFDPAVLTNNAIRDKLEPCVRIYLELEQKLVVLNKLIYIFGKETNPLWEQSPQGNGGIIVRMKDYIMENLEDLRGHDHTNYQRCLNDLTEQRISFGRWDFKTSLSTCRKHLVNISRRIVQSKVEKILMNLHLVEYNNLLIQQIENLGNLNSNLTHNKLKELKFDIIFQLYKDTLSDVKSKRLKIPDYARPRVSYKTQYAEIKELLEQSLPHGYFYLFNTLKRHADLPLGNPTNSPFTEEIKNLRITHYTANQFLYTILTALCEKSAGVNTNFLLEFLYNFDHAYVDLRRYETQLSAGVQKNTFKAFEEIKQEECNLHLQTIEYIHFISLYKLFSALNITWPLNSINSYNIGLSMAALITEISGNYRYQIFTKPGEVDFNNFLITTDEPQKTQIRLASFDWHKTSIAEIYNIITLVLGYQDIAAFRNAIIHLLNEMDKRFYLELMLHFHFREDSMHLIAG